MDFFGNLMQQTCGIQKRTRRWVVWWYGLVVSNPECNMNLHLYACMYVCLFLCPSMFPVFSFEFSSENKNESKNDFFDKSLVFLAARSHLRWMVHAATQHDTIQRNTTNSIHMKSLRRISNVSKHTPFVVDVDVACIYFLIVVIIIIIIDRIRKIGTSVRNNNTAKIAVSTWRAGKATKQGTSKQCSFGRRPKLFQYTNEWMTQYHNDWLTNTQGNSCTGKAHYFIYFHPSMARSFVHAGRHGPSWFIDRPDLANHAT